MPRSKPSKKTETTKKQPAAGKVEKKSKKEEKAPQKGVEKVAKAVEEQKPAAAKSVKPVKQAKQEKKPAKKEEKKPAKKEEKKPAKKEEKKPAKKEQKKPAKKEEKKKAESSSSDEDMSSSSGESFEGSSSSASGSSPSSSGSSSSGSGSGSSSSGSGDSSSDADGDTEMKEAEPKKTATPPAKAAQPAKTEAAATSKVFIGNLPWTITDDDVKEFFSDCGTITNIHWNERDGRFSGNGFLTFKSPDEASKAIAKNGQDLKGRNVKVGPESGPTRGEFPPTSTLVLKGLSTAVTSDDLQAAFPTATAVRVTPSGLAFLDFETIEAATEARDASAEVEFPDSEFVAEFARPKKEFNTPERGGQKGGFQRGGQQRGFQRGGQRGSFGGGSGSFKTPKPDGGKTFFVGGLPYDVDEAAVKKAFTGCDVNTIRWVEKEGEFKGVAFVEFKDTQTADKAAVIAKGGVTIGGRAARLDWAGDRKQ